MIKITQVFVFLMSALFLVNCGFEQVSVRQTGHFPQTSSNQEADLATEIHNEVNRYRASQGLKQLRFHKGLSKIAKPHSNYMRKHAGSFSLNSQKSLISHYGFESRSILAERKYRIESIGENVIASHDLGQGRELAATMVRGWLRSPDHKFNIEQDWSLTGVAVSFDDRGRVFVTQLFGTPPSQVLRVGGPSEWR